ncbi:MAG: 1-deoxy-D-xylulose-5-phosphate reductoisomerase [Halothiobacillus sp.]
MKSLAIFGSTGSIGQSTLAVVRLHPQHYRVQSLVANTQVDILWAQIQEFHPSKVGVADPAAAARLRERIVTHMPDASLRPEVIDQPEQIAALAAEESVDVVVAAIVGVAGLASTWAAVRAGKQVLLANKESLVAAGQIMMTAVAESGATLLPIDSEHNAIFQCLPVGEEPAKAVDKLILTASGGPFRTHSLERFSEITVEEACRHPNWSMGRKISVDSATMMNKGLEVIEASWLFGMPASRIDVIVHPQSVIHSMVQFADGSVLAQMGLPDMRTPIAHALAWPERIDSGVAPLDFTALNGLHFHAPDFERFPCLRLAYAAIESGGNAPLVLNAANEVAVAAFLDGRIAFNDISRLIEDVMNSVQSGTRTAAPESMEAVLDENEWARAMASAAVIRFENSRG